MDCSHQIIVIGAGAAGMMAAGHAAELGASVLLLEKMERPGKKILITGNGHCNLTNDRDIDGFIAQFGPDGNFLRGAFERFFNADLLAFLRRHKIECKTKWDGKIYPVSENAREMVRVFQNYLDDGQVALQVGVQVTGVLVENGRVSGVSTNAGNMPGSAVILAAGGSSHPQTGSTGDGFRIAAELGHTIVRLRPALTPLITVDAEQAKLWQGVSLSKVRVTAFQCPSEKIDLSLIPSRDVGRGLPGGVLYPPVIESRTGDVSIVYFGIGGSVILEMSLAIINALENGPVSVSVSLLKEKDYDKLRAKLQSRLDKHATFQNLIRKYLPPKAADLIRTMTGLPLDKLANQITPEERERLFNLLKSLRFDIKSAYSMSSAIVTAGGIALNEIHSLTMGSRLVEGLYFCGEVMDLDAGTGGYNLQAAFSTGYVAGESAAEFVRERS